MASHRGIFTIRLPATKPKPRRFVSGFGPLGAKSANGGPTRASSERLAAWFEADKQRPREVTFGSGVAVTLVGPPETEVVGVHRVGSPTGDANPDVSRTLRTPNQWDCLVSRVILGGATGPKVTRTSLEMASSSVIS